MNKKLLLTSIIAFVVVVAIAVTAVLVNTNPAPLVSDPINNNGDVLLSVSGPDSTVDYNVSSDVTYDLLADSSVTAATIASKVLVTDTDGNAVSVTFADKGDGLFTVNPPAGGYRAGAVYTINLQSGVSFADEAKAGLTNWDFIVAKAPVESVVYQDNVVTLAANSFTINSETSISSISDFAAGTIIIVPVGEAFEAYKVESSAYNAAGYELTVSEPTKDEVFKSIDVSGKYTLRDGTLTFNEEVLLSQLYNSDLALSFGSFLPNISFPRAEINTAEGLVYLDILFVFNNLICGVESSVSILVSNIIEIEPFVNYSTFPLTFNIGADMAIETTTTITASVGQTYDGQYDMEDLIAGLADLTKQTLSENFYRAFSWTYPLGTTGLFLSYDLDLVVRVSFAGSLSATTTNYSEYRLGVYYVNNDLKAICDKKSSSFSLDSIEMFGDLEAKAGLLNSLSLSFLQIAKVGINLEAGVYVDVYGAVVFNLDNILESQGGYYLDTGLYYDLSISAGIEILGFGTSKNIPLLGDKFSLYEAGSRTLVVDYVTDVADGAVNEILVSSNSYMIPNLTIKQFDLVSKNYSLVKVGYEKSNFVTESVDNFIVENGVIKLKPESLDTFSEVLFVQYKAKNTVSHAIVVSKDRELPYLTSEAILTFDKSAPASLSFTIDLIDETIVDIVGDGLSDYTFEDGVLTLGWEYLIRRPNGVLEIDFVTTKNVVKVWVEIENAVSLYTVGQGTVADPYLIYTVDQIIELAQGANEYHDGLVFMLADDIDMRGSTYAPIANFKGTLDGDGKSIFNFNVSSLGADNAAGLFAKNSGTIKNLIINGNVTINGQRTVSAGTVAGLNYGTIDNVTVLGVVTVECKTNNLNRTFFNIGGVVGFNKGVINATTADNTLNVTTSSYNVLTKAYMGGIAGFNEGTITNCSADINNINDDVAWYNGCKKAQIANS